MSGAPAKNNVWKLVAHALFAVLQAVIAVGVHDMRTDIREAKGAADRAGVEIALIQDSMFTKLEGADLASKIGVLEKGPDFSLADRSDYILSNAQRLTVVEMFLRNQVKDQSLFK